MPPEDNIPFNRISSGSDPGESGRFTSAWDNVENMIEIISRGVHAGRTRVALFDFDGTVSLIRSGWMEVMVPMMVELLAKTGSGETEAELTAVVEEFVGRLTGKQTIYQMIELAENIGKRGQKPEDPLVYKKMYLELLWRRIEHRIDELRKGHCSPEKYLVPGARALLQALVDRGYKMYLASGTDDAYVQDEARLLDVHRYFTGVHGALDDYKSFSKAILIQQIISSAEFAGEEFLGFGDGYVEIENIKQVGGFAVGVATNEPHCLTVDTWKRERLIRVGADIIIPDYRDLDELESALFAEAVVRG
jgi:phosphoglycolate phosphatase-like HAD superfamily hydrolase